MKNSYQTIDEYIGSFPREVQKTLNEIRKTIKAAAPEATEVISYGMPAFKMRTVLVYFAAFKNHIGFFPTGSAITKFKTEFGSHITGKGTVQFSFVETIPYTLIEKVVKFRVGEDLASK